MFVWGSDVVSHGFGGGGRGGLHGGEEAHVDVVQLLVGIFCRGRSARGKWGGGSHHFAFTIEQPSVVDFGEGAMDGEDVIDGRVGATFENARDGSRRNL